MELKPDDYILAYWMASDKQNNNWYMMVWKHNDTWHSEYTFRYCANGEDQDPWNGKDEKNVYTYKFKGEMSEKDLLKKMNDLFDVIKKRFNDFSDFFLVQGDFTKFKEIAETKHYLHIRQEHAVDG